ncbi:MAG TPA: hypothetical protein VHZ50_18210 [Puia sp.]|nr:hypothetical protein [Puia sp.]
MKRFFSNTNQLLFLFVIAISFSNCVKDSFKHKYTIAVPVNQKLSVLRTQIASVAPTSLQNTGKIYVKDNLILINEMDKGIHVIDNSNPSQPKNIAFLNIPGNRDMAMQGNILYADMYCDLLAIDISNPNKIVIEKTLTNIDPYRLSEYNNSTNADSLFITTSWIIKDTVVSDDQYNTWRTCINCGIHTMPAGAIFYSAAANSSAATTTPGTAGSEARFAIVNNYLYALGSFVLNIVDVSQPANPLLGNAAYTIENAQTIYPFQNTLFIGALTGMAALDISNPSQPQQLDWTAHWCMGDPVISDGKYAYVTLSASSKCHTTYDQLEIYDASDLSNMQLIKSYPFSSPQGLSKDGNLLFICNAAGGLQILDATDVTNLKLLKNITGINAQNVITQNGKALIVAEGKLVQYDYSDITNVKLLSTISAGN